MDITDPLEGAKQVLVKVHVGARTAAKFKELCAAQECSVAERLRQLIRQEVEGWAAKRWIYEGRPDKAKASGPGRPRDPETVKRGKAACERVMQTYRSLLASKSRESFEQYYAAYYQQALAKQAAGEWEYFITFDDLQPWNLRKWNGEEAKLAELLPLE